MNRPEQAGETPRGTAAAPPKSASGKAVARLGTATLLLTGVVLAVLPLFAWVGYQRSGDAGRQAALVAAAITWCGSSAALWLTGLPAGGRDALSGALLGMLFRLGLPLVAGIVFHERGGPLAAAGVFGMIVAYYLLTLFAETVLAVRFLQRRGSAPH